MKVFITGAGGFLGKHLAQELVRQGNEVHTLQRSDYPELEDIGCINHKGCISDKGLLLKRLKDMDVVFHVASKVSMWGDWSEFYQTNVIGTQNIVDVCQELNISKLIYTSSPSAIYSTHDLENVDESIAYPEKYLAFYGKSKAMAERIVLQANSPKLKTIALRPHLIFGPGDQHIVPRLIKMAQKKRLKQIGPGKNKVDVVFIDNAVWAHLCALSALENNPMARGRPYFIGQEKPVELWTFIKRILQANNIELSKTVIPTSLAYFLGASFEWIYKIVGVTKHEPPLTRFVVKQMSTNHYFSHHQAEKELGYHPKVNLEEAILRSFPLV